MIANNIAATTAPEGLGIPSFKNTAPKKKGRNDNWKKKKISYNRVTHDKH